MKNKVLTIETDNIYVGDDIQCGKHRGYVVAVETDRVKVRWITQSGYNLILREYFAPKRVFTVDGF